MRIKEIFYTLQGEGKHTGTAAIFIRLEGCNLRCPFCDTDFENGREMTVEEIAEAIAPFPAEHVVITGGEPTLQITADFLRMLRTRGKYIQMETNGTSDISDELLNMIDWITCSPKGAPVKLRRIDELKVVMGGSSAVHPDMFESIVESKEVFLSLQPCDMGNLHENQKILEETISYILSHPQWHLSLQTHKMLNIP